MLCILNAVLVLTSGLLTASFTGSRPLLGRIVGRGKEEGGEEVSSPDVADEKAEKKTAEGAVKKRDEGDVEKAVQV